MQLPDDMPTTQIVKARGIQKNIIDLLHAYENQLADPDYPIDKGEDDNRYHIEAYLKKVKLENNLTVFLKQFQGYETVTTHELNDIDSTLPLVCFNDVADYYSRPTSAANSVDN